ncbi:MAG: radical SAM protein, partial [Candidatus Competibacterales bacterium]|nr:radical SAM protein [Candidatus Competibacterales bacterium]
LDESFFALFEDPRLMPHLHLPLQSGSDRVLRRMARRCWRDDFLCLAGQAAAAIPDLNLGTDLIVGFPGETEADWRQTLETVEAGGFGQLHICPFSPRTGTRAAELPDQVDAGTRRRRLQELHALGRRLQRRMLERQCGRIRPVLREGSGWGYTPNYLRVALPDLPGDAPAIRPVRLTGVDPGGEFLHAEPLADR